MSKFDWVLSQEEKDGIINLAHDRDGAPCLYELAVRVEQAVLAKLAGQEPIGYSDKTGKHYFKDLTLAKRLLPDEEFIPLYTHPSPPVKQEPIGYLHANELSYIDAKSGTKEELYAYDYTIPLYAAPVPQTHTKQPLEMAPEGFQIVPKEPTEEMHHAARDWSVEKYGKAIGSEASHGCYQAMLAAAPKHKGSNDD